MTPLETTTPFEQDMAEQPAALRRLAAAEPADLRRVTGPWERIVLTGMGSSHFAGIPTWRHLVGAGRQAWSIDAGLLLDDPALLAPATLLIATSQSGESGEIVELLARQRSGQIAQTALIGITDDGASTLARAADVVVPLRSGPEATVSTKSYLNTLAAHRLLRAAFAGDDLDGVWGRELHDAADAVEVLLGDAGCAAALAQVAQATAKHPARSLSYIGSRDSVATALFSALITKESAKMAAEGYTTGQFRHGPFELAGDGHTAVLFFPHDDADSAADLSLRTLATDLVRAGSHVVTVGDPGADATTRIAVPGTCALAAMATGAVVTELFAVALARANGVVPGAFVHGSKITTTL
ncbi:MAG TPA: SIS domain-containing protein [Pseudonocardia sp.]